MKGKIILALFVIGIIFAVGSMIRNTKAALEPVQNNPQTCSATGKCSCGVSGAQTCGASCRNTNSTCGCKK